jgi:NADPH-dependent 2,4-dienoyl-CoA reductase/sulfur reductase-like enzyme
MSRLVIIGESDAGISAALRAREFDAGSEVTVVVADRFPKYSICGLPFYLSGEVPDWHQLAHRIDAFATALFHHMSIDDLNHLDLSYTPPVSSPWNPIQTSAQEWVRAQ